MKTAIVVIFLLLLLTPVAAMTSELSILGGAAEHVATGPVQLVTVSITSPAGPPPVPVQLAAGAVSDVQRFQLALNAGWGPVDAIIATAISIAEDGSGNPVALSPPNRNNSYDFCLWQINSSWWPSFGGQQALADPQTCANAAHTIWSHGGWTQWCTYPGGCGGGPGSPAWPQALARAKAAASGEHP